MTDTHVNPDSTDWQALLPTDPEGIPVPAHVVVGYGADGRAWTDEDVRRYWRRTARTTMRAAFLCDGYTPEVADDVTVRMERVVRGYHGPEQRTLPVPFAPLALDGIAEGFEQAWTQPRELLDPAEDEAPTDAHRAAAVTRARHARGLFTDSLTRPHGGTTP